MSSARSLGRVPRGPTVRIAFPPVVNLGSKRLSQFGAISCPIRLVAATTLPRMVRSLARSRWWVPAPSHFRSVRGGTMSSNPPSSSKESGANPAEQPRPADPTAPGTSSRSRYAIDPETIAAGRLPQRAPVVTSAANPHYQKHLDRLFGLAQAGDWDGVRNYEVKGSNSYSKND